MMTSLEEQAIGHVFLDGCSRLKPTLLYSKPSSPLSLKTQNPKQATLPQNLPKPLSTKARPVHVHQ